MPELTAESFVSAMEKIEGKLRSYAHTFTYNQDAVEDLLQELRILAVQKRANYDPSTGELGLTAWLKRILENLGMRYRKRMARGVEISWNSGFDDADPNITFAAEHALRERYEDESWEEERDERWEQQKQRCRDIFRTTILTDLQRECVVAHLKGEKQVTTADRLGIKQSVVSEHLRAAVRKLRKAHEKRWGRSVATTLNANYLRVVKGSAREILPRS